MTSLSNDYIEDLVYNTFFRLLFHLFIPQDLHMVELEDFKYGGTNITALRLVDPSDEKVCSNSLEATNTKEGVTVFDGQTQVRLSHLGP